MKRFLNVVVLAAALLGLLAAPALASAPSAAPAFRHALNTAYIFVYGDGTWYEVKGDVEAPTAVWHFPTYDDDGNFVAPADAIPATYDVVMQFAWKNINYGLVQTYPLAFDLKIAIPEAGVDLSYEQAKAYWTGVSLWDQYMINLTWPIEPFNPNIGAQVYAIRWWPSLTGENSIATKNLTADKMLLPGTYHVYYSEKWLRTYINLDLLTDESGQPLNKSPYRITPEGELVNAPLHLHHS